MTLKSLSITINYYNILITIILYNIYTNLSLFVTLYNVEYIYLRRSKPVNVRQDIYQNNWLIDESDRKV